MRKAIVAALALAVGAATLGFGQLKAKDGVYFAQEGDPAMQTGGGWKNVVVVTVSGGRITKVVFNGVSNLGVADKRSVAAAGQYGMQKASKIGAEWDQQANAVGDYIVKTQDVGFGKFKANGTTDAISGATFAVQPLFALLNRALASSPVARGPFRKDGWFFAQQPAFDPGTGWKDTVLVTVANGTIVDVIWNGVNKDPKMKSKVVEAAQGRYGMARAARQGEWNVQAAAVQAAILKAGDPARIPVKADGTTDAISGASIHVTGVALAVEALKAAR